MFYKSKFAAAIGMAAALACAPFGVQAANPIVKDIYTADPAALVDNGRPTCTSAVMKRAPRIRITA
ncbi:hypothetical protein ACQ4WP_00735 [Janthinobacterium sp. GB4P2]|uniref:hypothetical protein n=1 Tax=Janthinobacterium sp. GB4P2 TaxID=3424189 RepID=UPI003F25F702